MQTEDTLNRAAKALIDRHSISAEEGEARLAAVRIAVVCGLEVVASPTLQAALLTAANAASRTFPGSVSVQFVGESGSVPPDARWLAPSLEDAVRRVAPDARFTQEVPEGAYAIVLGTRPDVPHGLRLTYDRWAAGVVPVGMAPILAERPGCAIAGVAAAGLALCEVFLQVAELNAEATFRETGVSLWRPDLHWRDRDAAGPEVANLPAEAWLLGLGHLGQAYLWNLAMLPYGEPGGVKVVLQDFDRVVKANHGPGLLTAISDVGRRKTKVAAAFGELRGFDVRVVDRRFDKDTRPADDEPQLALCGFDGGGPRDLLDRQSFQRVVECGLGGRFDNFDSMLLHALPSVTHRAAKLWPPGGAAATQDRAVERLANSNPVYTVVRDAKACGHVSLARRAVAVPFVGAVAGSLVVAEAVRPLNGGLSFARVDYRLSMPRSISATPVDARGARPPLVASTPALSEHAGAGVTPMADAMPKPLVAGPGPSVPLGHDVRTSPSSNDSTITSSSNAG